MDEAKQIQSNNQPGGKTKVSSSQPSPPAMGEQEKAGKDQQQKKSQQQGKQQQGSKQKKVGWPEWVTFAIGLVIILGVVGLQIYLHLNSEIGPPEILVSPRLGTVYQVQSAYYLPVEVTNTGGETAEDVQVQLTLEGTEGKAETVTFTIGFLSPEEVSETVVIFKTDPSMGQLSYLATFKNP